MAYSVYLSINGVKTYISDSTPLEVIDISNLGASKATRITERSPAQDGDTDINRVLEPRVIPLVLQGIPNATYTYEDIRAEINRLFKATNATVALGFEYNNGARYEINVKSIGDIELPLNLRSQAVVKAAVTLRAANPTFYDPSLRSVNFGLTGAGATLVPTVIPMLVGGSGLDQSLIIAYTGTYRDYPIILIDGPVTNLKIENLSTGYKLDFTGATINAGDRYTIDLRYGRKIVYRNDNLADSRLNEMTTDSNLAQFAIEADPEIPDGINSIRVTGSALTSATAIYIQYFDRFDGI